MASVFDEILNQVNEIEIIDSHEHLPVREDARNKDTDVLEEFLFQYFDRDLVSAGLEPELAKRAKDTNLPILERWQIVEPYWNISRHTGYGRSLDITAKGVYGIEQINGNTIEQLNDAFKKSLKPGHFRRVLKDLSNIKVCLTLTADLNCDPEFFRAVVSLDHFIYPRTTTDISQVSRESGVSICNFDDWLEASENYLDQSFAQGAVALKCSLAYNRSLYFKRVSKNEAEVCFNEIFKSAHNPDWELNPLVLGKAFQDYMMHYILRLANKRNLTFQFHTGIQEGNGNYIANSDPSLLNNLFLEYPDVDFDLFHIGYPYQHVISVLAKSFPNVYVDMCWAHIISPVASRQILGEWLETMPYNKIIAFGGDYHFIDAVYGHQYLARKNVSKTLAAKVEEGLFDIDEAIKIANCLFYDNPLKLFKLENKI